MPMGLVFDEFDSDLYTAAIAVVISPESLLADL